MHLAAQNYGKQRVRVLKVLRASPRHQVKELQVGVRLEGDFESSYIAADNSKVVATDTMKNVVQVLAHRHLEDETEPFARLLVEHFLERYAQIDRVTIETSERRWVPLEIDGVQHEHSFRGGEGTPVVKVVAARSGEVEIESGVVDILLLKTTGSGFVGFPRCEHTTLPETDDRVLSTLLEARWRHAAMPESFAGINAAVVEAMLRVFASRYSPSVQATIAEMAEAAFRVAPGIDRIALALPNKHYLPANLAPFGEDGKGVSFVPTDEPHGQIEATFTRG